VRLRTGHYRRTHCRDTCRTSASVQVPRNLDDQPYPCTRGEYRKAISVRINAKIDRSGPTADSYRLSSTRVALFAKALFSHRSEKWATPVSLQSL
jgi:hypothetical protein